MNQDTLSWMPFAASLTAFLLAHAIPARPPIRRRLVGILGERAYTALYSIMSLLLLGWVFRSATEAPYVELWPALDWQRLVPQFVVPLSMALGTVGLFTANPLSLSARRGGTDQDGTILAITRHPVLWALALWAAAHIVPNGDLARLTLFGGLLALCLVGMVAMDRRARRRLGPDRWAALSADRPLVPFSRPGALRWPSARESRLAATGLAVAVVAALLHETIIGLPAI
ncbi:NnrU family protein [Devosia oryziradicis]|uniref:NnrU family protein n=1 Tax=Devosia oryziradicis TaxID=2801335 RepID=A0ABX7BW96_9HYPH|nr:NnrU family protein [Devosia oryziradicis]QQR36213.1 NnrU family protein [Devosia oryziradicis]